MRIHRLISILLIIENHGMIKAKHLSQQLEVSTRTIYRDVEILCEAGFPIYTIMGAKGGIRFSEKYKLGITSIPDDELMPLVLRSLSNIPIEKNMLNSQINNILLQIKDSLSSTGSKSSPLSGKILIDDTSWWGEKKNEFDFKNIIEALWQLSTLQIDYQKKEGTTSTRLINPYGIILKSTTWYLVAYCHSAKSMRTFLCNRMKKIVVTNQYYQIPNTFSLNDYWEKSTNQFVKTKKSEEIYPVTIKILKNLSSILSQYEVYELCEKSNHYIVNINLHKYEFACDEILHLLSLCEIIEPHEIRMVAKKVLNQQSKLYL